MAGIFSHVEDDIDRLRALKKEIKEVKESLQGINVKVDIDIKAGLESQLKSLTTQYDALAQKIADTEGGIKNSMNNINRVTEQIKQVQSNAMDKSASESAPKENATTSNVEAQARAYQELQSQINALIGSKDANIARMRVESEAITRIKATIAELNNVQKINGSLTDSQAKYLDKLNAELMARKQSVSELGITLRQQIKLEQTAEGSMKQLSIQLGLMRQAYRELTEVEKNSPFGQELLASIQQADQAIKGMDASIGNYQRNVGNYAGQWNGLNMSIQQLAREMPSLAYGPQVFFSAISNNLPILADEIKRAKNEYNELKKAGENATPVWKQIASSLISWQTALTVGITLLTLYGDKIVAWVGSLFNANNELKELQKQMAKQAEELKESFTNSFGQSAGKMRAEYEELRRKWSKIDSEAEKLKFIEKHKDEIHKFGYEVKNVTEAEDFFIKNTDNVVKSFEARAKAVASMEMTTKIWQDFFKTLDKIEESKEARVKEAREKAGRSTPYFTPMTEQGVGIAKPEDAVSSAIKQNEEIEKKINKAIEEEISLAKKERDKQIEKYKKVHEEANKELETLGAKEEIDTGKDLEAEEKERKRLEKEAQAEAKYENKRNKLEDEATRKRERNLRKNEIETAQLQIDLLKDSSSKKLKQLELDYTKEQLAIQQWEEDLRATKIEEARKTFEADPKNKGKVFDSSSVDTKLTEDEEALKNQKTINALINFLNERNRINNEDFNREKEARAEYIRNFGTYLEQLELLQAQHNERMWSLKTQGEKDLEVANFEKAKQDLKTKFGIDTGSFVELFEDPSEKSVKAIQKVIDKYQGLLNIMKNSKNKPITKDQLAGLGLTDKQMDDVVTGKVQIKDLTEAIERLHDALANKSPFSSFSDSLKRAINDIKNANGDLGKIGTGVSNIGNAVSTFTPALSDFSSSLSSIFGYDDAEVQDVIGAIGGLGETAKGVGQMMSGDIVGGLMSTAKGVADVVKNIKSLSDRDNERRIKRLQSQIEVLQGNYDDLGKSIEKAYSTDASKMIEQQNKVLEQQKVLINQQIKEEEDKKNTDNAKIEEYKKRLEEIDNVIADNKEKAIDAIFGEDLQSAIDRFASSYADAVASGTSKWDSAKKFVKDTIKMMVVQSIKGALASSKAIEKIRESLTTFLADGMLTISEKATLDKLEKEAIAEIEARTKGVEDFLKDDTAEQEATGRGIASLTQEQGDKLEGRFSAVQLATERTANATEIQTQEITLLNATMADFVNMMKQSQNSNSLDGIADQIALSYLELQDINENTSASAKYLKDIKADIAEVKKNTANLV